MKTYRQLLVHIVFATRSREPALDANRMVDLYRYIWGICKHKECHLFRIGGYQDHIHLLVHLHPSISTSDFVRTIKTNSSRWIKEEKIFPRFQHWQDGYGAFSVSYPDRNQLINYIKNQEEHHHKISFLDEYRSLLAEHDIEIDEKYLP